MLNDAISTFPPEYQFTAWVTVFLALLVAAALWFYRKLNAPVATAASSPIDLKVLGAAIANDRAQQDAAEALKDIAKSLRELKAIYDRSAERDIERFVKLTESMAEIANGVSDIASSHGEKPARRNKG